MRSRGFAGKRAELTVRLISDPHAQPIATMPLTLADGEQTPELVIETDRAKGGLLAEVSSFPHEAVASNNSVAFQISPRESKLRVIYMEGNRSGRIPLLAGRTSGRPRHQVHVDAAWAISTMPGRGFRASATPRVVIRRRGKSSSATTWSSAATSPARRSPPSSSRGRSSWSRKRGGGFAMIGGKTSFGSGGWDQTVWDGLIPVDMSGRGPQRSENYWARLRVVIPPQAMDHPIWRIVDDPERNRQVLAALPTFYGTNLTDRLKPAATALGLSAGPVRRFAGCDRLFVPDVRPRPHIRHVERHDRRLGTRLRAHLGRRRQPLFPQVLAKRRALACREQRGEPARGCGSKPTRSSTVRARKSRSRPMPTTRRSERRTATGWSRVFVGPNEPESTSFDATADSLTPEPKDAVLSRQAHGAAAGPGPGEPGLDAA